MHDFIGEHMGKNRLQDDQISAILPCRQPNVTSLKCPRWVVQSVLNIVVEENKIRESHTYVLGTPLNGRSDRVRPDVMAVLQYLGQRYSIPANSAADFHNVIGVLNSNILLEKSNVN